MSLRNRIAAVAAVLALVVAACGGTADDPVDVDLGDPVVGGLLVDGGLTVGETLTTDAVGVIAVKGFLVQDAAGARLCDLLAESLPPQCGGASIDLSDTSTIDPGEMKSEQGVTWTDQTVTVFGEIIDGVLVVTSPST